MICVQSFFRFGFLLRHVDNRAVRDSMLGWNVVVNTSFSATTLTHAAEKLPSTPRFRALSCFSRTDWTRKIIMMPLISWLGCIQLIKGRERPETCTAGSQEENSESAVEELWLKETRHKDPVLWSTLPLTFTGGQDIQIYLHVFRCNFVTMCA